jgi:hypothetical protein
MMPCGGCGKLWRPALAVAITGLHGSDSLALQHHESADSESLYPLAHSLLHVLSSSAHTVQLAVPHLLGPATPAFSG